MHPCQAIEVRNSFFLYVFMGRLIGSVGGGSLSKNKRQRWWWGYIAYIIIIINSSATSTSTCKSPEVKWTAKSIWIVLRDYFKNNTLNFWWSFSLKILLAWGQKMKGIKCKKCTVQGRQLRGIQWMLTATYTIKMLIGHFSDTGFDVKASKASGQMGNTKFAFATLP